MVQSTFISVVAVGSTVFTYFTFRFVSTIHRCGYVVSFRICFVFLYLDSLKFLLSQTDLFNRIYLGCAHVSF